MFYCGVSSFELLIDKAWLLIHKTVNSKHNLLINCHVNKTQTIQNTYNVN